MKFSWHTSCLQPDTVPERARNDSTRYADADNDLYGGAQ